MNTFKDLQPTQSVITVADILAWGACYNPVARGLCAEDWSGTVVDVLRAEQIPVADLFWLVLRTELIAERTLHEFALWCAEQASALVSNLEPRSLAALEAKRQWLRGEITEQELSVARTAAECAAWDATRDSAEYAAASAVQDTARDTALAAAEYAARTAARTAAECTPGAPRDAAENAAECAAWDAARSAVQVSVRDTAWVVAWGAARNTARAAQVRQLLSMLETAAPSS